MFSQLVGLLQVVEEAADLVVGVAHEAGVDLGHPCEELLLVVGERVPGARDVERRERLAVGPCARLGRPIGLIGGSSVSAGTIPSFFWRASVCSRIAS